MSRFQSLPSQGWSRENHAPPGARLLAHWSSLHQSKPRDPSMSVVRGVENSSLIAPFQDWERAQHTFHSLLLSLCLLQRFYQLIYLLLSVIETRRDAQ